MLSGICYRADNDGSVYVFRCLSVYVTCGDCVEVLEFDVLKSPIPISYLVIRTSYFPVTNCVEVLEFEVLKSLNPDFVPRNSYLVPS